MPKIRRISIQNFRSIVDLRMDATDLTVIVGDNDCGKSNVLRALNLFFNGITNPGTPFNFTDDYNRFAEEKTKQAKEIEVVLDLELPESYRQKNGDIIRWRKRWRANGLQKTDDYWGIRFEKLKRGDGHREVVIPKEGRSRVPSLLSKIQFEYVPAVRSAEFFRNLRGRIFEVIASAAEHTVREGSGQFEQVISQSVTGLLEDIGTELNENARLSLPNDLTPLFQSLDFLSLEKSISLDNRGDGIKARYIPLILKFIAEKSKDTSGIVPTFIWAYEEPENNLEFRRAQELADAFYNLAESELSQVFLTTHSPIFYNMHKGENREICTAHHLSKTESFTGTTSRSALEANISLDDTMGAMAIIAPHIRAAQEALLSATTHAADMKAKLERYNPQNLPTIFVEGITDYTVFKTLLEQFRPDIADKIYIAEPPQRAGANYVTNMLRSWEYRTKHLPNTERSKAVGLIDADQEGNDAYQRFKTEDRANWKHVFLLQLDIPPHLKKAYDIGFNIPVSLEELWPINIWQHAEQQGWLTARSKEAVFGEKIHRYIIDNQDQPLSSLLEDAWRIYYDKCVDDIAKTNWAHYIANLECDQLEEASATQLAVLDKAISKLGI